MGLLFQKGYPFLPCMYILKMSKLLREEWRGEKMGAKFFCQLLSHNQPCLSTQVFPQAEARCFFYFPLSCWCGPAVSIMLGVHAFSSIYILSHSSHHMFFLCFFSLSHPCIFEHVSVFNTCDLGCYLGALFSCSTCLLTPYFSYICGSFYSENLHKLGLNIVFCLF